MHPQPGPNRTDESTMRVAELTSLGVLVVSGTDAQTFLQGQLTADINALAPHSATSAAWCTAKGRVLASLIVLRRDDDFVLVIDRSLAAGIARRLSMYVLRSKVQVRDDSSQTALFGLDGSDLPPGPELAWTACRAGVIDWLCLGPGHWLGIATSLTCSVDTLAQTAGYETHSESQWRCGELSAGRVWIGTATQDAYTPQMLNLDLTGGVSFTKGCYPGQEIVARTHYLGKVKRRLLRARLAASAALKPELGMAVHGADPLAAAVGQLVDLARSDDGSHQVLFLAQPDVLAAALHLGAADGPRLEPQPLPFTLD